MPDQNGARRDPRFAMGQSIGLAAFVWGYPLVETVRTCALQTGPRGAKPVAWHAVIDRLQHSTRAATAEDRDIVTPANDLLYTTGWINLANGPRLLHVPSSSSHKRRYFVLALYDAWTNNFENPGLRSSPPEGETVVLVGPGTPSAIKLPEGARLVRSPTDLVWMIARVVVGEGQDAAAMADMSEARALQAEIRLEHPPGTEDARRPSSVMNWVGEPEDTIAAILARPQEAEATANQFFRNLCQCLGDAQIPAADAGLADWFKGAKIAPGAPFDFSLLDPALRDGLKQGLLDAVAMIVGASRSRVARPWAAHFGLGRYGTNYLTRALTAYKGLGALVAEEAVYAMGDFDDAKQPLSGTNGYALHFAKGDFPPVDAFWSVTLYDADRFLYENAQARYSIGDRTHGLVFDPDGGLTLEIGHARPPNAANWLPGPAGSFYLILRMYCPRPEARGWRIPALRNLSQASRA